VPGTPPAGQTAAPTEQVRAKPGIYDGKIPPTAAEMDPLANGVPGGTLFARYLDPPHMDVNQVLSCTVTHNLLYTTNKLLRGKTGALADANKVELEPDLAESFETPDGATYTFHLHRGVKTHNVPPVQGREYTSEDVRLSLERYRAGWSQSDVYMNVTSIEAPDDHTVVIKLDRPQADFPADVAAWSYLLVREFIEDDEQLRRRAVGTGPFIQESWEPKQRSVFVKHPDYFEKGLPFLDRVETAVQNDPAAVRAGFETNNYWDWGARDDADAEEMLRRVPDLLVQKQPLANIPNTLGFWFQMSNPKFQDVRVRRAMSLAFDRNEYDIARNAGDNQNPEGPFSFISTPPWPLLFDAYPTAKVQGPWYQFDPEQASQLMQAAGYTKDQPLDFQIVGFYQRVTIPEAVIPLISQSLPEVNISFREVDNPTHATLMADRNFKDALGYLIPSFLSFDMTTYPWYHSEGAVNYNNVNDPKMDEMLERQRSELDETARKGQWREIWDYIHDQVWEIAWPSAFQRSAWHNYVLNYRPHAWMGAYICYTNDQARAMWLTEDAPVRRG
jgi:peptide/nickel transport system substrate-binding protein